MSARRNPSDYALLKKEIRDAGLFEPQPVYYIVRVIGSLVLLGAVLALLLTAESLGRVLLASVLLGPAILQAGSFTHDNGHRAMVGRGRASDALGMFFANVVAGVSWSWWRAKHNAHHAHPNDPDRDPDVNIAFLAFTPEQARAKRGIARFIARHQAPLFVLLLPFEALHLRLASIKHLVSARPRYRSIEVALLTLHTVALVAAVLVALPTGWALLALAISDASLGLCLGAIFAPNHKGMPMAPDADYLRRQVLTARNIRPGPFVDFWYIGLNYQIEHHLFPTLPRNRLRAARRIVRRFCEERGIEYTEVGLLRSFVEVFKGLSEAGAEPSPNAVTETAGG